MKDLALPTCRRVIGAAALCLAAALPARADMVSDWLAGAPMGPSPAITHDGPPVELKFGHPVPPASLVPPIWQKAFARLEAQTNGKLKTTEFGGGTLISVRDGIRAVRSGVAEWATCYTTFEGRGFELSRVFEQPFVAHPNPMVTTRIAQELAAEYFAPEFTRQEVTYATLGAFRPSDILSRTPIRTWEDLRGKKIVAQGFPPEVADAMGATFISVPFPEIYVALQQGLADAVFWLDAGFIPYRLYEVAKYHTTVGMTGGGIHHCYNTAWFDGLPADLQDAFLRLQEPMAMSIAKVTGVDFPQKARETYLANGVEMLTLSDEELARWKANVAPVFEAWVAKVEADGKPIRAMLAKIDALKAEYGALSPDELMRLAVEEPVLPPR